MVRSGPHGSNPGSSSSELGQNPPVPPTALDDQPEHSGPGRHLHPSAEEFTHSPGRTPRLPGVGASLASGWDDSEAGALQVPPGKAQPATASSAAVNTLHWSPWPVSPGPSAPPSKLPALESLTPSLLLEEPTLRHWTDGLEKWTELCLGPTPNIRTRHLSTGPHEKRLNCVTA